MITTSHTPLAADTRRILAAQALRAFGYGFASVLLGVTLKERGYSTIQTGAVLTAVVAGTVFASLVVARYGDRVGRRRTYGALYLLLGITGCVYAVAGSPWALAAVALVGALSSDVVESGPFTSLEQSMLASDLRGRELVHGFGLYNAVATAAGSIGALSAGLPELLRHVWSSAPADQRCFLVLVPIAAGGFAIAQMLSAAVEADDRGQPARQLGRSRGVVRRLACIFAIDAFGGGFVVQAFIAYWLTRQFGASPATVGAVFFAIGVLQTVSLLVAPRIADHIGLLSTMVFTHLPSNILLVAVGFAPNLSVAVALLLARTALSQMDVPARQAYVMLLVDPADRTAAAAYTNTARYIVRPIGPLLAGGALAIGAGVPFAIAGTIKSAYDLTIWRTFRDVPLADSYEGSAP